MGTLRGFLSVNKRKILASAQRHIQKGSLEKALRDYLRLLEADPRDANVRLKVGDLQLRRNQPKEAIDSYLKVADQFMRDGFDAKAVAIYKQVTKIDGKRYEVYLPLAELYQRLGLVSEAMAALQSAADGYQQEGKRRDALDLLRKMSSLDPSNVPSRLKVADLLAKEELFADAVTEYDEIVAEAERQGDWETQIAVFERIVEVDPSRIASAQSFSRLLLERNQTEQAEHVARKCVEADPDRAESNELLGEVLTALGKTSEAAPFFKRAAAAWRELGDEAKARDLVQRYVSDDDIDFGAGDLRNEDSNASPFGETSLETDVRFDDSPTRGIGELADPDAEMDLGFDADSNSTSAKAAEELPELVPEPVDEEAVDAEQLLAEASVYVRYGKHEKAIEAVQSVLHHEPNNAVALEQLGDTLAAAGHDAPAVDAWVKAARLLSSDADEEKIESLRSRIAARNQQAALEVSAPAAPAPEASAAQPPQAPPAAEVSAPAARPAPPVVELEEIELELVEAPAMPAEPAMTAESETPTPPAQEPAPVHAAEATREDDIDIDVDLDFEGLDGDDAESADSASSSGASTSTSAQIAEELTEADSLFDRGLLDQAEAIYQRILDVAPNHPAAQLRVGEIADAREEAAREAARRSALAEEPPTPAPEESAEAESAAGAPESSGTDELSLDLNDDIDLQAALAEAAEAVDPTDEVAEPPAPSPVHAAPEEPPSSEEGEADDGSIALEFDIGEDPEVSFAGLDPSAREPELDEDDAAPLEFEDEVEFADVEPPHAAHSPIAPQQLPEPPAREASGERSDTAPAQTPPAAAPPDIAPPVEAPDAAQPTSPASAVAEFAPPEAPAVESVAAPEPAPAAATDEVVAPISFDAGEFDPDESFDLAAELSTALAEEPGATGSGLAKEEQTGSLETLFGEFKRGVEQTLGAGDVETHFDLGIAYREMGLFDDAIGEFQYALASENRRLDALHLMALCALELDRPADATAHLEQALSSAEWPEDREAPLRFDLGRAYEAVGDPARALDTFRRVAEINPSFGDVEARIAALEAAGADPDGDSGAQEAYESFDDLIDATSEPEPDDTEMESFEEFQDFDADDDPERATGGRTPPRPDAGDTHDGNDDSASSSTGGTSRRRRKVSFI